LAALFGRLRAVTGQSREIDSLPSGKLRRLAVTGAPLDLALKSRIEAEFDLPLRNGYGITECAPGIAGVCGGDAPRDDEAAGSLVAGIEARLVGRTALLWRRGRSASCASGDPMSCAAIVEPQSGLRR
jgi:acyl-coenzyme A synthetase/AMP-(fatty) acid ligase